MTPEELYNEIPVVTRTYFTLAFVTTLACYLDLVSPFSLYFNWNLIVNKLEVWRLLTNFLFFGSFGLDFFFHMFFLYESITLFFILRPLSWDSAHASLNRIRYCRLLEEGSFRGHTADFVWMLVLGGAFLTTIAPFVSIHFLGSSLTFMMVYVWGRRNEHVRLNFWGVFHFTAPYLPWVLLMFSVMLGNSPVVDLLGMAAGHIYFFFDDVYPLTANGRRPLRAPKLLKRLLGDEEDEAAVPVFAVLNENERFQWGDANAQAQEGQPDQHWQQ